MKRILTATLVSIYLLFAGCAHVEVYTGDHGSNEFKVTDPDHHPTYMTEVHHFGNANSAWYLAADNSPNRMVWYDYTIVNGTRRWYIGWTDFDSQVHYANIAGMRRLALDPSANRVLYEKITSGKYALYALSYSALAADPQPADGNIVEHKPDLAQAELLFETETSLHHLYVNSTEREVFWIDRRDPTNLVLKGYDLKDSSTGALKSYMNSSDHSYMNYMQYIAVDPVNGYIYWSQNRAGAADDFIGRAKYKDGSNMARWISNIPSGDYLVSYPAQLDIEYKTGRLFWVDMNMNWLVSCKLDGASIQERDFRILDNYPADLGTKGPNYHPTSVRVVYHPGITVEFEPGLLPISSNAGANRNVNRTGVIVEPFDPNNTATHKKDPTDLTTNLPPDFVLPVPNIR